MPPYNDADIDATANGNRDAKTASEPMQVTHEPTAETTQPQPQLLGTQS